MVTDNARSELAAVRHAQLELPNMVSLGCSAHLLQLAIKDAFSDSPLVTETLDKNHRIIQFFKKSNVAMKLLHAAQHKSSNPPLNLKQKVSTRWNSEWISTERLLEVKADLRCGKN
jgi:hypothetical protein